MKWERGRGSICDDAAMMPIICWCLVLMTEGVKMPKNFMTSYYHDYVTDL